MPWARIPCDKLVTIGLFGYELEKEDGRNLWYRGPNNQLYCIDRYAPRFWFESVTDAVQAGCVAVKISGTDEAEKAEFERAMAEREGADENEASADAPPEK